MPPIRNDDDITQMLPQMTNERCGLRLLRINKIIVVRGGCSNYIFLEKALFFNSVSGTYRTLCSKSTSSLPKQ